MKIASAKAKGRGLQQKIASKLLAAFPQLEEGDIRSTSMSSGGEDVQLSPAARALVPHCIEAKKHAKHAVYTFYDQANTHGKHQPLVVIEADRRKPLAIVDFDFYVELLKFRQFFLAGKTENLLTDKPSDVHKDARPILAA